MLEFISTIVWVILLLLLAASSISFAVDSFKKRRYFWFGLNIMWAVMDTILIVFKLLSFYI